MPKPSECLFPTPIGLQTELTSLSDDNLKRRGFSDVVSYSVDWQGSVYIPPASGGVSYSASAIPSASAWNSYSNSHWQSYSQSSGPSYHASMSSMPAALSSVGGGRPAPSRGPNNHNNGAQNSQSTSGAAAASSAAPSPASPGAASTFSNFGCTMTVLLAALTGVAAFVL
jgi:hypothetical protein